MLGFSLPKLIVLAAIIAAIWYGFKFFSRAQKSADKEVSGDDTDSVIPDAVDMIKCDTCGDFVAAKGTSACGKEGCPYPG
jgi:uncharacterized protein